MANTSTKMNKSYVYVRPSDAIKAELADTSTDLGHLVFDPLGRGALDVPTDGPSYAAGMRGVRSTVGAGVESGQFGRFTPDAADALAAAAVTTGSAYALDASAIAAAANAVATAATGFGSGGRPASADGIPGWGPGGRPVNDPAGVPGWGEDGTRGNRPDTAGNPGTGNGDGDGDGIPDRPDDAGNPGRGNGDGTGDGDGISDKPAPAPTPPDVPLLNEETANWHSEYTFSLSDITVGYDGQTLATNPENMDLTTSMETKEGVTLHPIDSEFGFYVTDFIGAEDKVWDGDFGEGWAGELPDGNGIAVADARTVTFSVPARMGTWLEGIGGNFVKASTEHYSVMQAILSDQAYPGDTSGMYQLDDNLHVVDWVLDEDGMPVFDEGLGAYQKDVMDGLYIKELTEALSDAEAFSAPGTLLAKNFDQSSDGSMESYYAYMADMEIDGEIRNVAVVDLGADGTIDYYDLGLNGFGTYGIQDILAPNESSVLTDIAVGDDYSVTVKDDGKLLYRWGNAVKRPNDIRIDAKLDLPDDWTADNDGDGTIDLYRVTAAELVVNHTVTNNPNDQIRPEDYENEAAIGQLPSFLAIRDPYDTAGYEDADGNWVGNVLWVSTAAYYAGDGTFLDSYLTTENTGVVAYGVDGVDVNLYVNVDEFGDPVGTVLRDFSLIDAVDGSTLDQIGALSSDLEGGYTEAWYTTMDREPFMAVYDPDTGDYEIGPRWRLQPDKYGQDLPSVIIPQDPSDAPPVANGEEMYEVGADTTTVLNLLDWDGTSPLALSAGWIAGAGDVSVNGVNMTEDFDVAFYVKGDIKPVNLYDAQLLMQYEEVEVLGEGEIVAGSISGDTLVGQGDNTFFLSGDGILVADSDADLFVLGYGATTVADIGLNTVYGFNAEEGDALGVVGFDLDGDNFNIHLTQEVVGDDLNLALDGVQIATLMDVTDFLEVDDFYFA